MDMQSPSSKPSPPSNGPGSSPNPSAPHGPRTAAEIQAWLIAYLADELQVNPAEVNISVPFDRFGLSSASALLMTGDLETWLGRELDPTLPYDYPTIEALAGHLGSN